MKKGVLRDFTEFTGKHLRQSLFYNKVAGLHFSCEFCEISRRTFFTEHLWTTASVEMWEKIPLKRTETDAREEH